MAIQVTLSVDATELELRVNELGLTGSRNKVISSIVEAFIKGDFDINTDGLVALPRTNSPSYYSLLAFTLYLLTQCKAGALVKELPNHKTFKLPDGVSVPLDSLNNEKNCMVFFCSCLGYAGRNDYDLEGFLDNLANSKSQQAADPF